MFSPIEDKHETNLKIFINLFRRFVDYLLLKLNNLAKLFFKEKFVVNMQILNKQSVLCTFIRN
jgi:hypothetical protein